MKVKRDRYGIIGQPNKPGYPDHIEGGDSMNWQGHLLYLSLYPKDVYKREIFIADYVKYFESKNYPGLYVRHPHPAASDYGWASYCEGNWRGVESRDQMTGKLCFFAKAKAKRPLWRCFVAHFGRFMLFANNTIHNGENPLTSGRKLPDLTAFDIWALYIRGFRAWPLYPLLLIFDLHLLVDATITRLTKSNDVISHVLKVITAREIMPTPLGYLASKISTSKHILKKVYDYWNGFRDQPGMYQLYIPYVERYWRK